MEMQHMKNSSQHKEFQCPVCLKFFSRKFTLEMHFLIHQGVKPHACPFCGKCFRQKGTLMRHKALHSTTALFHCGLCNRSFRQKNVFLHHLKHRHKVSTENLDRRKWRTQVTDSESLMNTLPPFASANTVAISTSDKNLENILFNSYNAPKLQNEGKGMSISVSSNMISDQECNINIKQRDNASRTSSDKTITAATNFSDCFNRNIPQSGSLWQCNVCSYEIPFDYLTCSAHISIHEQKLKHKCCLCLKLFLTNSDYHQHMSTYHDNSKLITEEIPSCSKLAICQNTIVSSNSQLLTLPTSNPLKLFQNGNSVPEMPLGSDQTSVFLKNVDLTIQPSDSYLMQDLANPPSNKQDMTFTCIPCQMDFTVEEDFECHVKTHVQSILLSDSESLEVDSSNNVENNDVPSLDKATLNSSKSNAIPLQLGDENGKNFTKYFSPSNEMFKTQNCNNNSVSTTFHQNLSGKTKTFDKTSKNGLDKTIDHNHANEELSCSALSEGPSHAKGRQDREFHCGQTTNESFPPVQNSDFTKQKRLCMKEKRKIRQLTYLNSSAPKHSHNIVKKKESSLQKLGTERQTHHSSVVYLCAFCRKHLSSARQLYRHVKLHIQSIGTKFIRKNVAGNSKNNTSKTKMSKTKQCKSDNLREEGLPSYTCSSTAKDLTNTKAGSVCNARIIQPHLRTKRPLHENIKKPSVVDNSTVIRDSAVLQKSSIQSSPMHSSSRVQYLYRCRKCRKTFSKKSIYHYHMQMHLSVCTFRCFTCHKKFLCKEQLLRHTRTNHLRSYQCKSCSRVFQYSVVYRRHSKSCKKVTSFNDLISAAGDISVPIITLQDTSRLNLENLVGIIPVSSKSLGNNAPGKAVAAIPVINPAATCQLDSLPIIGNLSLFSS